MATYFTADTHYYHERSLIFGNRPFENVDAMNEALIERWNSRVGPHDTIYVLGDFAFRNRVGQVASVFDRLQGIKHLVIGNHDNADVLALPWASKADLVEIKLTTLAAVQHKVVLCHYPMRSWNGMYRSSLHLYGHEHGNIPDLHNACDVGVDSWNWYPVTIDEACGRMARAMRNPIGPDRFPAAS